MLERLGGRYVGHPPGPDGRRWRASASRAASSPSYVDYLRPIEKDGNVWLYEIIGWPR